jgi:hypothetical protein
MKRSSSTTCSAKTNSTTTSHNWISKALSAKLVGLLEKIFGGRKVHESELLAWTKNFPFFGEFYQFSRIFKEIDCGFIRQADEFFVRAFLL